jgi:uncharacterized protein (TIGR02452 family)
MDEEKEQLKKYRRGIFKKNETLYDRTRTPKSFSFNIQNIVSGPVCKQSQGSTIIEFLQMTTNNAIRHYFSEGISGSKICALNFANASYVGGGVTKGSIAQEETLCLTSPMLYYSLAGVGNGSEFNDGSLQYSDTSRIPRNERWKRRITLSPNVEFIRDDKTLQFLDTRDIYTASIISAAAPNNKSKREPLSETEMHDIERVIRNILDVAGCRDFDVLILGAWGCGAFAPQKGFSPIDPRVYVNTIAHIFKKVIKSSQTKLKIICFAIPQKSKHDKLDNYDIFEKHFIDLKKEQAEARQAVAPQAVAQQAVAQQAVAPQAVAVVSSLAPAPARTQLQTKIDVLTDAIKKIIKNAIISKIIKKQ